jgi:3-phenylpropionate/trans-cinnamate dioxygenase ferredoxin subunit
MKHKVAKISEVNQGTMKEVNVMGKSILLVNLNGEFFAMGDICTHEHCNLSTGFLDGSTVYCPCHGGQYEVTTGAVVAPPPTQPEPVYAVTVEGEDIYIEMDTP